MPNHVRTRIHFSDISDDRFNEIVTQFTKRDENYADEQVLDFEKIIPMPADIYRGNLGAEEEAKYGAKNWYDWSIRNWGTKWNAYDGYVDSVGHNMEFLTAWNYPEPVINRLAVLTKCDLEVIYADEDYGYNCGKVDFSKDGDVSEYAITENSEEAWDIVEILWNISKKEYLEDINAQ